MEITNDDNIPIQGLINVVKHGDGSMYGKSVSKLDAISLLGVKLMFEEDELIKLAIEELFLLVLNDSERDECEKFCVLNYFLDSDVILSRRTQVRFDDFCSDPKNAKLMYIATEPQVIMRCS